MESKASTRTKSRQRFRCLDGKTCGRCRRIHPHIDQISSTGFLRAKQIAPRAWSEGAVLSQETLLPFRTEQDASLAERARQQRLSRTQVLALHRPYEPTRFARAPCRPRQFPTLRCLAATSFASATATSG